MLTVHHLGVSQSERIIWLCEELGVPYELKRYEREPDTRLAPPAYRALHPIGIAPIITDGDVVLPESGAIIEYVIGRYGNGRLAVGPEAPNYADYLFWLHFANATLLPSGAATAAAKPGEPETPRARMVRERNVRAWNLVEDRLCRAPYFAGDELTGADIIMVFPLTTMRVYSPRDLTPYPNIRAYLKRIGERPAYRRAMEKGDPGMTPLLS